MSSGIYRSQARGAYEITQEQISGAVMFTIGNPSQWSEVFTLTEFQSKLVDVYLKNDAYAKFELGVGEAPNQSVIYAGLVSKGTFLKPCKIPAGVHLWCRFYIDGSGATDFAIALLG